MSPVTEHTVGVYEAKTHFHELLKRVEGGKEVTITRYGSPVARLVPIRKAKTREERRAAIEAMRAIAKGNSLRGMSIKDLMNEGRR